MASPLELSSVFSKKCLSTVNITNYPDLANFLVLTKKFVKSVVYCTAFMAACILKQKEVFQLLLEHSKDIDTNIPENFKIFINEDVLKLTKLKF